MADKDTLFDQRIHDAYEQIELSEAAQQRVLEQLLAAQGQGQAAEVVPAPRSHRKTGVWLPLAAALIVALVVVQGAFVAGSTYKSNATSTTLARSTEKALDGAMVASEGATDEGAAANDGATTNATTTDDFATDEEAAEQDLAAETAPLSGPAADGQPLAQSHPQIELPDGTLLTTLADGSTATEVDAAQVGDSRGTATASSSDDGSRLSCEVFSLTEEPGAYAVRYEGQDDFWRCTPGG